MTDLPFSHPWSTVTLAFWLRYPNPYSGHVLSADVIDRKVDPITHCLHTTRLITKRGIIPKWGQRFVKQSEALILEESIVDPFKQEMTTRTRNITLQGVMRVEETQLLKSVQSSSSSFPPTTSVTVIARVVSDLGWGLKGRIEKFGVKKFMENAAKSQKGMRHVLDVLTNKTPSSVPA